MLYKSGTEGFANSGNEPYAEFYAYQVAEAMGLDAIPYNLSKYNGKLCSTCELFPSKEVSYVPASRVVTSGGINAVLEYYSNLGESFLEKLIDMFVFDAVICNTDRHFGNFGFLVDNHSNKIINNAPIFDNGLSLWCYAMENDFADIDSYVNTRTPATYADFIEFAKAYMTDAQRDKLKKLQSFKFKKHTRYNWSNRRLEVVESIIHKRVEELLN